MNESETIYYPQDEINTMLLPVTEGCSYNQCTFCSMYKGVEYKETSLEQIRQVLRNADMYTERLFLVGADPLCVGFEKMMKILEEVKKALPYCACVASYTAVKTLKKYTKDQLAELHDNGLRLLYIGVESGSSKTLGLMHKGHTPLECVEQGKKLNEAHLMYNAIIMYGSAGAGECVENAKETAKMLNQMNPEKIITMNLTLFMGTKLYNAAEKGDYIPAPVSERCAELSELIKNLYPEKKVMIDTTHPTNIKRIRGYLPDEREELLEKLSDKKLSGNKL